MIALRDRHADSVVVTLLVFPQELKVAGVKKVGVWIERSEHARNSALVQRLIRIHRIGEVLLHYTVNFREYLETAPDIVFIGGGSHLDTRAKNAPEKGTKYDNKQQIE